MNTDRELRILRATGIEGIVESFEEYVKLSKITSFSLNLAYILMFLLLFSMYLPGPIILGIAIFVGAEVIGTYLWIGIQLPKKIEFEWHIFSQYLEIRKFLGLCVFIAVALPTSALIISYYTRHLTLILIFSLLGLVPISAIHFILKSAKKWPLSIIRTFKGPYTKEEFERIKNSLNLECGKVERAKWSNEFKLNCHGFRVRIIPLSNFKNYQIRIIIEGVDERNALQVKGVVEKIEEIIQRD